MNYVRSGAIAVPIKAFRPDEDYSATFMIQDVGMDNYSLNLDQTPVMVPAVAEGVLKIGVDVGGSGYTSVPSVDSQWWRWITGAAATAVLKGGSVDHIIVTNRGTGYTSAPTVDITATPAGVDATATAEVGAGVGYQEVDMHRGVQVAQHAIIIRGISADIAGGFAQYYVPYASLEGNSEVKYAKTGAAMLQYKFRALWDVTGVFGFAKLRIQNTL